MNWLASDRYRFLRTAFIAIILISLLLGVFIVLFPGNDEIEAWLILLTLLFSVLASPPASNFVEEAFWKARNTGADDVRARLKAYWIDDYLRAEERNYDLEMLSKLRPSILNYDISSVKFQELSLESYVYPRYKPDSSSSAQASTTGADGTVFLRSEDGMAISLEEPETIVTIFDQFTDHVIKDDDITGEYIIIIGEKGSRKSVELLKLAEHLHANDTRVPVYLNLFSWAADCKSLAVWLADEIHHQYNIVHWKAKHMIENNYLVLLLDGFEEVPTERRRHLIAAIREFLMTRTSPEVKQGNAPIDLRDSVVIATVKAPPPPTTTTTEDALDTNTATGISDSDDNLQILDLAQHQLELFYTLQSIGTANVTKPQAPVLSIEIKPLEDWDVIRFTEVALTDIAARGITRYYDEDRPFEEILKKNIKNIINKKINKAIIEELKDLLSIEFRDGAQPTIRLNQRQVIMPTKPEDQKFLKMLGERPFILKALLESRRFSLDEFKFKTKDPDYTPNYLREPRQIIEAYVIDSLRQQPGNIGPTAQLDRVELLSRVAKWMNRRQQRVLDQSSSVFYLEEVGFRMFMREGSVEGSKQSRPFDEFRGLVALVTTVFFLAAFGLYMLVVRANFDQTSAIIVTFLFLLFGRIFGWTSCGNIEDDRMTIQYPLQWFPAPGFSAGIFMSLIVGIVFFQVSEVVYGELDQEPLLYEAMVSALFTFALFFLIGGVEIGRRFRIVAHPYQGQSFLLVTTVVSVIGWFLFFFLFLFWPRARFELLSPEALEAWTSSALLYSLYTGLLIGIVSGIVLSHLYIRHLIVFFYLRQNNIPAQYSQVLEHNARPEIGILRRLGGGYLFRHRYIMDYFIDVYDQDVEA